MHPLNLTKSVLDPVHGLIRLTEEELGVVNSPIFQRLRRIKQNGLLSYVFPAASHSRFEHSLGVLCVVESMLQALIRNGEVAAGKNPTEVGSGPSEAVTIPGALSESSIFQLFRIARLAALCHDLGHGPLSHTFDAFAPNREAVVILLSGSGSEVYAAFAKKIAQEKNGRIDHEWMSCILFAELFRQQSPEDELTALAVAATLRNDPSLVPDADLARIVPLMSGLIASAPADADRMDYVERDSRSAGVSYGLFDRGRVLKSLLCYLDDQGCLRLGIKSSGFRAIENFIQARFELFVQVYYHKTNRAIELMLAEIGAIAKERGTLIFRQDSLKELIDDYISVGDDEFLDMIVGRHGSRPVEDKDIQSLAQDVKARRLWRRIEDFREALIPRDKEEEFFVKLKEQYPHEHLMIDTVQPKATKDLDKGAALLFRGEDGVYRVSSAFNWMDISRLIACLAEQEKQIVRIYYKGTDSDVAKRIRLSALKLETHFRSGVKQ